MAYTSEVKVRNLLPDLLIEESDLGISDSGTLLTLINPAFGVPTILKDSTTLALTTDYSFVQPRTITLGTAATGENYTATVYIAFSDEEILVFVGESDRIIDAKFINQTAPGAEYQDDWSKYLSAAKILRVKAHGNEDMLNWADSMEKIAMDGITDYLARTSAGTYDDSGISRCDATPVDAFQFDQSGIQTFGCDDDYE